MSLTSRQLRLLKGDFPTERTRTKTEKRKLRKERQATKKSTGGVKLLMVNDDLDFAVKVQKAAALQGFELTTTGTIESLSHGVVGYSAVIIDSDLSGANCFEVARYICSQLGPVPIVFTGSVDQVSAIEASNLQSPMVFVHKARGPLKIIDQAKLMLMKVTMETPVAA